LISDEFALDDRIVLDMMCVVWLLCVLLLRENNILFFSNPF